MANDIKIVRLTTGEELICETVVTDAGVTIKKPLLLVPVSIENLSLIPWLSYADFPEDGLAIPEKIIAFVVSPHKRLAAEHAKAFNKIIAPEAGDIMSGANMNQLGSKLRLSTT